MAPPEGFLVPAGDIKKAAVVSRSWATINTAGVTEVLDLDKFAIMQRVRIHARDLRILDPLLSYPSTILGRERIIVVNLEVQHIKAIITAEEVLLRDPLDDNVVPIVEELRRRLPDFDCDGQGEEEDQIGVQNDNQSGKENALRFEFRALEVMLEGICSFLDARTTELETTTYPALDELTSKICGRNLDRVRKLKSAMTRLTSRVQKIRDELEHLLDNDDDMAGLYLSRKLDGGDSPLTGVSVPNSYPTSPATATRIPRASRASADMVHGENDVEELEMLLEAYFMQADSTLNKLNTLHGYIDNTEDYINIQLDNHRNQLIQIELFVSSSSICLSLYSLVTAIFGMNIPYTWREHHEYMFKWVVIFTGVACGSLFLSIMSYARHKGLVGS